ncbi:MAG: hypothetical protein R2828_26050 [Saprospiraceae bacterium]
MRITIETTDIKELEILMKLLRELNLENINVIESEKIEEKEEFLIKGDKSIDPNELFGIWREKPRTIEEIRSKSWDRNWN